MLKGKTALVTGTNRGIGKAILETFAKNGANVFAHARKETPEFAEFIDKLAKENAVSIIPVYFDTTDYEAMKNVLKSQILKSKTNLDILVNCAGVAHGGFFQMTPVSKIKEVFEINLFSQMELTQLVLKKMTRQNHGSIINVGSISGLDLKEGNCAYGVSKAAFMAFTKTLAYECARYNIRVNAIAPGLTDTDMAKQMEENAGSEMVSASVMKRLGKPEEIANAVLFIASDKSSFVNAQVIRVDGGRV